MGSSLILARSKTVWVAPMTLPILSPSSLKKIGTSLCQLQEDQLDEHLLMTKNKLEPVGKKVKKTKKTHGKTPGGEEGGEKEDKNNNED